MPSTLPPPQGLWAESWAGEGAGDPQSSWGRSRAPEREFLTKAGKGVWGWGGGGTGFGNHWYHISWLDICLGSSPAVWAVICLCPRREKRHQWEKAGLPERMAREQGLSHSLEGGMLDCPMGLKAWAEWLAPTPDSHIWMRGLQPRESVKWAVGGGEEEPSPACCGTPSPFSSKPHPLWEARRLWMRYEMGVYTGLD